MAALHAYRKNPRLNVVVVAKGQIGQSGCTRMVQGGYNAVLDPNDSFERHFEDTIRGGGFINNQELAWLLVKQAPRIIAELESLGCFFDRDSQGIYLPEGLRRTEFRPHSPPGRPHRHRDNVPAERECPGIRA